MTTRNYRFTAFLCGLTMMLWLCAGKAHAQTVTGSITGTVTDPSGAVIPGAHVTAKNADTGVQTETTTNNSGDYTIRFLQIGTYSVTVVAQDFSPQTAPLFALEIDQTAKINASLKVNASSTNLDVHAEVAPILNTTDATLATTFTANELANLPLNGGNFSEVTIFQAGAVATSPTGFTGNNAIERETYNSGTASINGNRGQANNYTLEGADNNEPQNNLIAYNPAVEALGEVRVISSNAPATYGNANGGAVVSLLKSGTNQFHGSAFMYLENYNLDANSWGNKHQTPIVPKNPYTQTQFGGTLGGPIWRSKKLFFFGDYKGVRKHTGGIGITSVIPNGGYQSSPLMRNGDFSALYSNGGVQLYNTQNNFTEYANNQVPIVNPVAIYLFAHPALYPLDNAKATDGLMANNFQGPTKSYVVNNQYDIKIEWDPGTTNKITAFYSEGRAYDGSSALIPTYFPSLNVYPSKLSGGSWIHTFSIAIVNEARFGFTRVRWDNSIPTDPSGVFGLKGDSIVGIPFGTQQYVGFSQQNFGSGNVGTSANTQILRDNTFNYYDNLTWQYGRQLFSIGVQATRYQQNYLNASNFGFLGSFSYNGQYTSDPGTSAGYGPADFVLDRVQSTALGSTLGIIGNRQWRSAGYVQDDWKVNEKLTLNLGLRYEFDQPWYEAHNKTANVVLVNGVAQLEYAGSIPAGAAPGATLCPTKACYNANWTQFMPRFGFAYQIAPRLVLRGGYGGTSFFEGDAFNQRLTSSPPFAVGSNPQAIAPSSTNGGTPFTVEEGLSQQFNDVTNSVYSIWPQNQQPAYISEYNLTTEYALTNFLSLSASYLGESGHHLADYGNPNGWTLAQANIFSLLSPSIQSNGPLPASLDTPYMNLPGVGPGGYVLITESRAMMNYNGLLVSLRQRTHHGLEYTINYTYAKAMTDSSGNYGSSPGTSGSSGAYQNYFDSAADYGPSSNDIRQNVTAIGTYALPFGRGQIHGSDMNRALDLIIGGWKISGTLINYTGLPITITGPNYLQTNNPGGGSRANQYRHFKITNRSLNHWWGTDPSAVPCTGPDNGVCAYGPESSTPGSLAFGTAAINTERAPGYRQIDSSLFKDFHIYREQSIGFRANFYNLFNIASYGNPSNNVTSTNFGQITSVTSPARQVELSAHYNF